MRTITQTYQNGERRTLFCVDLINAQTLGASCGYGTGETRQEAIANALAKARASDPLAIYDGGSVIFNGGINC